ncbi:MAG: DsbA family protein [Candidatus Dojkabacteria bacterium]|nr:DsbA family protein [Candidatus Dojkabacteria bacterium]
MKRSIPLLIKRIQSQIHNLLLRFQSFDLKFPRIESKLKKFKYNFNLLVSISIIVSSLIVSVTFIFAFNLHNVIYKNLIYILPKYAFYSFKIPQNYDSTNSVLEGQPILTYNVNAKYIFVENSDLDCINCAKFHGYQQNRDSSFEKLSRDFLITGKLTYIFIDKQGLGDIKKHSSLYCAGEQDAKAFFELKTIYYKNFTAFDLNKAKEYFNSIKSSKTLDINKFESCINSGQYEEHVRKISGFSSDILGTTGTPTFYLYEIKEVTTKTLDGKTSQTKTYNLLAKIVGNQNYEIGIKPVLEKAIR